MRKRAGLYTEAELQQIIAQRGEGKTEKEIAALLGRPYNSVHCKIKELRKAGRLPLVRDITPVSEEDINALAVKHRVSVDWVNIVIDRVGSRMRTRLDDVDRALLAFNAQGWRCAYFGVGISLEAPVGSPTLAVLTKDRRGRVIWISKMASKMRGKLSHETFLKSITTIYEHVFTKDK